MKVIKITKHDSYIIKYYKVFIVSQFRRRRQIQFPSKSLQIWSVTNLCECKYDRNTYLETYTLTVLVRSVIY